MERLRFQPLKQEDIPQIYAWLQQPHVREFYHPKPVLWEQTREHYTRRLDPGSPTKCFLSYAADHPIGYIQTYRMADYPGYTAMLGETEGISLDLFIGDPAYLEKGWGRAMLAKFLSDIVFPLYPDENVCWIYHDVTNQRALRASQSAGFRHVRDFTEDGKAKQLLTLRRNEISC
jgi:aminoglycoside 6'-N-acetyltransferase